MNGHLWAVLHGDAARDELHPLGTRSLFFDEVTAYRCLTAVAPQGATVRTVAAMLPRSPPVHASSTMSKIRALTG